MADLAQEVNTAADPSGSSDAPIIVEGDPLSLKLWPDFLPVDAGNSSARSSVKRRGERPAERKCVLPYSSSVGLISVIKDTDFDDRDRPFNVGK